MFSLVEESFIILLSVYICVETGSYDELTYLGASCYPRDSCSHRRSQDSSKDAGMTCECDPKCQRRGTCCIDSPYVDSRQTTRHEVCAGDTIIGVEHFYYFRNTGSRSFYQVTKCNRQWNGPVEVKERCQMNAVDGADLMVAIPVTNINSGISYKNYFCAICNNDIEGSVLWDVHIYDEDQKSLVSDRFNVEALDDSFNGFSNSRRNASVCAGRDVLPLQFMYPSYGYWDNCSYSLPYFVSVNVQIAIPKEVQPYVKGCLYEAVSVCPRGWTNAQISRKCAEYMGLVKGLTFSADEGFHQRTKYYRNAHCAVCNNITSFVGFSCEDLSMGPLIITPTYPTSVTIPIEHLLSAEGCLGDKKQARGLGCRAVLCASSLHKVKNGKCSPP